MNEKEIIEKIETFLEIEKNGFSGHLEAETIKGLLDLYKEKQKENQELKKRINKTLGIMDHLDSLDAEQFYKVDQALKGAENHIPRID